MTIQELADAHVGHPEELGEDSIITAQRESFKWGALRVLEEIEDTLQNPDNDYLPMWHCYIKIKELKGEL